MEYFKANVEVDSNVYSPLCLLSRGYAVPLETKLAISKIKHFSMSNESTSPRSANLELCNFLKPPFILGYKNSTDAPLEDQILNKPEKIEM